MKKTVNLRQNFIMIVHTYMQSGLLRHGDGGGGGGGEVP